MSVNINTQTTKVPANFELPVSITGNFVLNKSSSGGLKLRFPNGALVDFNEGDKYRLEAGTQFGNIHLVNESGSDVDVTFTYGVGDADAGGLAIQGVVTTAGGGTGSFGATTVGTSFVEVIAANASRTGWTIQNNGTAPIYIGSTDAVTVSNGLKIVAGGTYGEDSQGSVYAISGTAGQDVRYREGTV